MRAVTISGTTLARVLILLAYALVCGLAVSLAVGLSFAGYVVFLIGSSRGALLFWGAAMVPLVGIGVLGTFLPEWIRRHSSTFPHPSINA